MPTPAEAEQRPYVKINGQAGHVHYDTRVDDWGMRRQILREARKLRRQTGAGHLEVIPGRWEWDENFSTIVIRDQDGKTRREFRRVEQGRRLKLREVPQTPTR